MLKVLAFKEVVGRRFSYVCTGVLRSGMATRAELDRRAHEGEVVVPGGTGGHSLEAQEHLAEGRHKGGETRARQLGHEGFVEMGKKGGLASHGADPYQAAAKQGVHIDEHKFMNDSSIEELDKRALNGEVIVPGGTGGHSLEAQKHLAEGRHKGGVTRAHQLGHEGYVEIGRKGGLA
ncbi:hypothetical protein M758_2G061300 [Ceratodon purpureus]|nr:hypothetical protein M758_2G061300 [Ceratodon purpureus]